MPRSRYASASESPALMLSTHFCDTTRPLAARFLYKPQDTVRVRSHPLRTMNVSCQSRCPGLLANPRTAVVLIICVCRFIREEVIVSVYSWPGSQGRVGGRGPHPVHVSLSSRPALAGAGLSLWWFPRLAGLCVFPLTSQETRGHAGLSQSLPPKPWP